MVWELAMTESYPGLDHGKYDERFRRLWEYYLACGAAAAAASTGALWQVLFANSHKIEIPLRRV
jgi:cyclopropane-fatty-acyl-phospholipid synthase